MDKTMRLVRAFYALGRINVAPVGAFPYGMGALMVPNAPVGQVVCFYVFGILTHCVGCAVNDIVDSRTDGLDPLRSGAPLVNGDCDRREALAFTCAATACAGVVAVWLSREMVGAIVPLLALLAIGVYGNACQKKFGGLHPFFVDWLFGIFIGAPVWLGILICGGRPTVSVLLLVASLVAQGPTLNMMRGNLKDLQHDRTVKAHTAALSLGVEPIGPNGEILLTRAFRHYCALVFAAAAVLLICAGIAAVSHPQQFTVRIVLAAVAAGFTLAATAELYISLRSETVTLRRFVRRVLFPMNVATLATAVSLCPRWEIFGICVATYAWSISLSVLAHWFARRRRLRLPPALTRTNSAR
ncbi:UbiA family prenyltransferase [Nocardia sp. NPDC127606]|uniref:UbiA family prenyltransferase n=1 Tax=Nocardia sp. NPDC127606 TaxID=3345406 RepID=UPI00362EEAAF